jgi:hypothetical protein
MYHPAKSEPEATHPELETKCEPALAEVRRRTAVKYSGVFYRVEEVSRERRKLC